MNTKRQPHSGTRADNTQPVLHLGTFTSSEEPKILSVPAVNPLSHNNPQTPLSATPWEQREKRLCFECTFSASLNVPKPRGRGGKKRKRHTGAQGCSKEKEALGIHSRKTTVGQERGPQTVKPQGQFLCKQLFENALPRSRREGHRDPISF